MAENTESIPFFIGLILIGAALFLLYLASHSYHEIAPAMQHNEGRTERRNRASRRHSSNGRSERLINRRRPRVHQEVRHVFQHDWLLTTLKGHSSNILDMEFSPNGKYLATCGEGEEQEEEEGGGSGSNSGSEGNKENFEATSKEFITRRQKKNHSRKEDGSKKTTRRTRRADSSTSKKWISTGSRNHSKLNLSESELTTVLRNYLLTPEQIMFLGYPCERPLDPGRAIIHKTCSPQGPMERDKLTPSSHSFDVNAREFVPSCYALNRKNINQVNDGNCLEKEKVSAHSESSESRVIKLSSRSNKECFCDSDLGDNSFPGMKNSNQIQSKCKQEVGAGYEKICVRCGRSFYVMLDGQYLTQEKCLYHWGKLRRVYGMGPAGAASVKSEFTCCKRKKNSKGCTTAKLHVWKGIDSDLDKPLDGFVKTEARDTCPPDGNYGIYSMDCEMCYTTQGLELTKITVVSTDGRIVYDSFVKPENTIIDYNTRFSGVTAEDFTKGNPAKCLKDVQNDLMGFISADTILIGHALENDLKALKMIHSTVIDTCILFPHYYGLPYRRSLRSLANCILKRNIQSSSHDSFEDAKTCMDLMLWRVKKDLRNDLERKRYPVIEKF